MTLPLQELCRHGTDCALCSRLRYHNRNAQRGTNHGRLHGTWPHGNQQADVLVRAKEKLKSGEEANPNEALLRVQEEMADDAGVDVDELGFDFEIDEPEKFAQGGIVGLHI